ncbi:cytochrome P450 704B1 [Tanacetum coccineum]
MVCAFVAKSKSNGVGFDGGLFFVTAIGDEPGVSRFQILLLIFLESLTHKSVTLLMIGVRSCLDQMKHDNLSRFIELGTSTENNIDDKSLRDTKSVSLLMIGVRSCLDQMKHDNSSRFIELGTDLENNIDDKSPRDAVLNFVIKERAEEENVSLKPCKTQDHESFDLRTKQFADLMTYDSLGKLYYLHVVITETRRLYPAIPQVFDAMAFFHEIEAKTLCRVQTAEKSKSKVCRYFLFANTLAVLAFDALCNAAIQKAEVSGHTF